MSIRSRGLAGCSIVCILLFASPPVSGGVPPEACCRPDAPCIDLPPDLCTGRSLGVDTTCAANGEECNPIPAAGEWGLVVMTLTLLSAGTIVLGRRGGGVASPFIGGAGQSHGRKPADHARTTRVSPGLRPVL